MVLRTNLKLKGKKNKSSYQILKLSYLIIRQFFFIILIKSKNKKSLMPLFLFLNKYFIFALK